MQTPQTPSRLGVIHTNPKPPPELHPTMMVNREDLKPAKTYIFYKKPQIFLEGFGNFTTSHKKNIHNVRYICLYTYIWVYFHEFHFRYNQSHGLFGMQTTHTIFLKFTDWFT